LANLEFLDSQGNRDNQENRGQLVTPDRREKKDNLDSRECLERMEKTARPWYATTKQIQTILTV
jgi:hypothetical protein